ncbi:MAG: hypothetical protein RIB63_09985, partial [Fulvivirga sp.]
MSRISMFLIFIIGAMVSCEDISSEITIDESSQTKNDQSIPLNYLEESLSGCTPNTGGPTSYDKTGSYNCHAYVRGALVAKKVNLTTGAPQNINFSSLGQNTIQFDNNFIRVCNISDADAIAHLPTGSDHSA